MVLNDQLKKSTKSQRILLGLISLIFSLFLTLNISNQHFHWLTNITDQFVIHADDAAADKSSNNDQQKDDKKDESSSSSDSESKDSDSDSQDTQDPWNAAVTDLSGKYDFSGKDNNPLKDKNNILGNVWSYLGPKNPIYTNETQNVLVANYKQDGSKGNDMQGAANRALAFGGQLTQTGLDHAIIQSGFSGTMITFGRLIGGLLLCLAYVIVIINNLGFGWIQNILQYFNVLTWFDKLPTTGPLAGVAETVMAFVHMLQDFGTTFWVLALTVSIVLGIMGFRFSSRDTHTQKESPGTYIPHEIMHYSLRIFNIVFLPLLLATCLSQAMSAFGGAYKDNLMSTSTYPIYANFADFEGAVEHSRLEMPNDIKLPVSYSDYPVLSQKQVLAFNAESAGRKNAQDVQASQQSGAVVGGDNKSGIINMAALSTLTDWMNGAAYYPSSYASFVKGHGEDDLANNDKIEETLKDDKKPYLTNGSLTGQKVYQTAQPSRSNSKIDAKDTGGLSTVGMYNYLSTSFTDGSAKYATNAKQQTSYDTIAHYKVGLTGRGFVAFANYILVAAELLSIGVFGLFTLLATLSAIVNGAVKMAAYAAGSATGAVSATVKLVQSVVMFLIEFAGGAFFYIVCVHLIIGLGQGANYLFPDVNKTGATASLIHQNFALASNQLAYGAYEIAIAVILWFLTIGFMKLRGVILKAFNEASQRAVQTLIGAPINHLGRGVPNTGINVANGNSYGGNDGEGGSYTTGGTGGSNNGYGSVAGTDGREQNARVANPNTLFGKAANYKAGKKEAIQAAERDKGRPLTADEQKAVEQQYARQQRGNRMLRGAANVMSAVGNPGTARAFNNLAADRDAIQQMKRASAFEDEKRRQQLESMGSPATADYQKNNQVAQQQKPFTEATQSMAEQTGDLLQPYSEDGINRKDAQRAVEAVSAQYGDAFQELAENGGSTQDLQNDVAQKQEAVQTAQTELDQLNNQALSEGETQQSRDLKKAEAQNKVEAAEQDLTKSQQSLATAVGMSPVNTGMLKSKEERKQHAQVTSLKNGAITDHLSSAQTQLNQVKQHATAKAPTLSQSAQAFDNLANAEKQKEQFLQQNGRDVTQWTNTQKQQYNDVIQTAKDAKTDLSNLGFDDATYANMDAIKQSQRQIADQGAALMSGQTNCNFDKGELKSNMIDQTMLDNHDLFSKQTDTKNTFKKV